MVLKTMVKGALTGAIIDVMLNEYLIDGTDLMFFQIQN